MAEGWARAIYGDRYAFYSAGTKKHGMNPYAVKVMEEVGVSLASHYSKTLDELPVKNMDIVLTVCSDAHENCPYFPGGRIIHHGFDDPPRLAAKLTSEEEILAIYRRVRDEIKAYIESMEAILKEGQ